MISEEQKNCQNNQQVQQQLKQNQIYKKQKILPKQIEIGKGNLNLEDFYDIVYNNVQIIVSPEAIKKLNETREFIDHITSANIRIYGLTTGFADLRNKCVPGDKSAQLSKNILLSHDAGIGKDLPKDVVLGAMLIRANALAIGYSGFTAEGLQILVEMINRKIIPIVQYTGSLGASGDLAQLARIGNAMMASPNVKVQYLDKIITAEEAFKLEKITPYIPQSKEGLALTNGTSFMNSMLCVAFIKEIHMLENLIASTSLFLDSVQAVDSAFYQCLSEIRGQYGQNLVAKIIMNLMENSSLIDRKGVQNDYSIRCIPQIYGPKFESILNAKHIIIKEMNSPTDNPLIFKNEQISNDVNPERIIEFKGNKYIVISGGNFHGENLSQIADIIRLCNSKIFITVERQTTYLLNPDRNKIQLPTYLIYDHQNAGLLSGFMIPQYTANSLAQQIAYLAAPVSNFNLTSANESEDVVSYGSTSALHLLEQIELCEQMINIYLTLCMQAYSIQRQQFYNQNQKYPNDFSIGEQVFQCVQQNIKNFYQFPIQKDIEMRPLYEQVNSCLNGFDLRAIIKFPLQSNQDVEIINNKTISIDQQGLL